MRKLLIFAVVFLFMGSIAMAANIPIVDPETNPSPVTTVVYSSAAVTAGDVVCWAADGSTSYDKNWVDTTCGADAWHVAGVVWPFAIGAGDSGTIAIYGIVPVNLEGSDKLAGSPLCASSTTAKAEGCADDSYIIGITTEDALGGDVIAQTMVNTINIGSSIPNVVDPVAGPEVWTLPVYSSSLLDVGNVVIWAIQDSSGDNDYWVEESSTADTVLVAGIVWPAPIAAGGTGTIAVRGIVTDETAGTTGVEGSIDAGDSVCMSSTSGVVHVCTSGSEKYSIGHGLATESGGGVLLYINP